jgi:hypothetical protein
MNAHIVGRDSGLLLNRHCTQRDAFRVCSVVVLPVNRGGLNRSMQHWLAVYSPAFEIPRSLAGVD